MFKANQVSYRNTVDKQKKNNLIIIKIYLSVNEIKYYLEKELIVSSYFKVKLNFCYYKMLFNKNINRVNFCLLNNVQIDNFYKFQIKISKYSSWILWINYNKLDIIFIN